jgi:hypothetical protein
MQEERLFRVFKDRAVALLPAAAFDDWSWLAYAQHLGIPTRLLDWTTSPLMAVFFALNAHNDEDRLVYCFKYSTYVYEVDRKEKSPFEHDRVGRYSPPLLFDRIRAQRGVFTIHPNPTALFFRKGMRVLRIPAHTVQKFRKQLFKYGFDHWQAFPDAEGLGQQLRWQYKNRIGLGLRGSPPTSDDDSTDGDGTEA